MQFNDILDILIFILMFFIFGPLTTLLHELAHSLAALLLTKENVVITLGSEKVNKSFNFGRLFIEIGECHDITCLVYGFFRYNMSTSKFYNIIILISGPIISLLIGLFGLYMLRQTMHINFFISSIFNSLFWISFFQFVLTLIPIKYSSGPYKGILSDGAKIINLIKNN